MNAVRAPGGDTGLKSLARLTGYSLHHLLRLFKAVTGITIHQHVDDVRLAAVQDLLAQGLARRDIALRLGFSSPTVFSRWLRKRGPHLCGGAGRRHRR